MNTLDTTDTSISNGNIYLNSDKCLVIVKDLSDTGVLIKLVDPNDLDKFTSLLDEPIIVDFEMPETSLFQIAEIVRIMKNEDERLLALEFIEQSIDGSNQVVQQQRRLERKNIFGTGYVIVDNQYIEFNALNISENGAKIFIPRKVAIEVNAEIVFKLDKTALSGKARVQWSDTNIGNGTMLGLAFLEKFLPTA